MNKSAKATILAPIGAALILAAPYASAQYTGEIDPVSIYLVNEDPATFTFDQAKITTGDGGASGSALIIVPGDNNSGDVHVDIKQSAFNDFSSSEFSAIVETSGNIHFNADFGSYITNGVKATSNGSITVDNRAIIRGVIKEEYDGETYYYYGREAANGYALSATDRIEFSNSGEIVTSSQGVSISANQSAGAEGNLHIVVRNITTKETDPEGWETSTMGWIESKANPYEDALSLGGFENGNNTIDVVNEGVIRQNYEELIPTRSAGQSALMQDPGTGAAVNIQSTIKGGTFVNSGAVEGGNRAFLVSGSNVTIDLREGSRVRGTIEFAQNSNNVLKVNDIEHHIGDGGNGGTTLGDILIGNAGGNAATRNKLQVSIIYKNRSGYDDDGNWYNDERGDQYGSLSTMGRADITDVDLVLDMVGADLQVGDTFTILEARSGITGSFFGLDGTQTRTITNEWGETVTQNGNYFSQNGYEFWISYEKDYLYGTETNETGVTSIVLEVMAVPEPAEIAALMGFAALLLTGAARRMKRRQI